MGLLSLFARQEAKQEQRDFHSRAEEDSASFKRDAGRRRANSASRDGDAFDPVLPEKKRARRRLIGAIALVLAVVVVLPMVLKSEPKPLASDVAIQIPSRDKESAAAAPAAASSSAASSAAAAAGSAAAVASASSALPAATGPQLAAASPPPATAPLKTPPKTVKAGESLDADEEIVDPAAMRKPKPEEKTPARDKTQEKHTEKSTDKARIDKPAADKPHDKAHDKASDKAPEKGHEKAQSQDKHAEKAQHEKAPEKTAEKAPEKALEKPAKKAARDDEAARAMAILEGREEAAPKAEAAAKPESKQRHLLQVAALNSAEKVAELQQKLSGAGIRSSVQKVQTANGETSRIRVGPFTSQEEADRMRAKLRALGLDAKRVDVAQ
ncbi:SPOR domain-containing protein [Massilia sp. W12]|uniref:SPOR domain-containing protein n=1 Tax=Massilia sp. W12 TaxID=3126507 RepID=UPI0030CFECB7